MILNRMNRMFLFFFLFIFEFIYSSAADAQSDGTDSAIYKKSVENVVDLYVNRLGENSNLYNGSEYIYSYHGIRGHPFFESDRLLNGEIEYDGILYKNVPMSYDLVRDEVFINEPGQNFNIKLVTEKIRYFSLSDRLFVRMLQDSMRNPSLTTGFYHVLYNGRVSVLARLTKKIQSGNAEDSIKFVQYTNFWVKKDNEYQPVENKKTLLNIFGDQKDPVRKYLRKNKVNYKKDPASAIIKAAEYYGSLKN